MKQKISPKTISIVFSVLVVCFAVGSYIYGAWTEPIVAPPGDNVSAPVNIGGTLQTKTGALGVGGIFRAWGGAVGANDGLTVLNGNVGIGTATPGSYKLNVNGSTYTNSLGVSTPGSTWLGGKTGTGGITAGTQQTTTAYHSMLRQTTSSGHVINLGGLGDVFGFFGYDVNRTVNGYDYSLVMNLANGNVGIGTATLGYKLDVGGDIRATGRVLWGGAASRTETKNDAGAIASKSGFFETASPINYYAGASSWQHLIEARHSNDGNNYALQIAGSFFDQKLYFRKTNNNPAQAWTEILTSASGGVSGSGSTNYVPLWTGASSLGNSAIYQSGTNVGIGTTSLGAKLDVNGNIKALGSSILAQSDNTNTAYWAAPIQLREAMYGATGGYLPPRISFHWGGVVASQIGIESSGRIAILNNPGTGYESLISGNFYAPIMYDSNNAGYYVDPNGYSNILKMRVNGELQVCGTSGCSHFAYPDGGGTNYLRGPLYFNSVLYDENNAAYYVDPASASIFNDLRANIFYDNNNTGYYVDPASGSNLQGYLMVSAEGRPSLRVGAAWGISGIYNGQDSVTIGTEPSYNIYLTVGGSHKLTVQGSTGRVGIGTTDPQAKLDVSGDGSAIIVPRKSTAGDPAGVNGMIYYNSNSNRFRVYENGGWKDLVGGGGFGNWVDMSAVASGGATQGPAATDGFVLAYTPSVAGETYDIFGKTDANNPPTTFVIRHISGAVYGENPSQHITMPVKKGHYWEVTGTSVTGSSPVEKVYWIPLGD